MLLGGRREERPGDSISICGVELTASGQLESTGVGPFDRGLLVTYETAAALAEASRRRAGGGIAYDASRVSAILILLADGTTPERVRFAVAQQPGLKVVSGGSLVTSIRQGASSLLGGVLVLALVFLLIAVMLVGLLYSAIVAERSREIGLLLALGSRGRHVVLMFLAEASVTTALGGLLGVVVGSGLLLAFRRSVGYALEMARVRFVWPPPAMFITIAAGCVLISAAIGLLGAAIPAWRQAGANRMSSFVARYPDMLEARELRKTYTTECGSCDAIRGVSLALQAGEFVAVVGRSGSGKSTLLAMLAGLCRPTSGTVAVNGVDLWALSEPERAAFRTREVGLVFQFASLLPTLRVIDNVALPALVGGDVADENAYRRATELLVRVELSHRAGAYPSELSGGEQRRAALARAIINAPPIVLADEPTSDLDEDTETEILDALEEIHRRDGVALVVVTHDPQIARRADRIIEIRNGSIVASRAGTSSLRESADACWPPKPKECTALVQTAGAPAPPNESSARLGAGLGPWLFSVSAWVVPAVFMGLAVNQGVSLYQRHLLNERTQAREALEDAALLWLQANIDDIAYNGGTSYALTLSLENRSAASPVFVLSPTVCAYVQAGLTWQEIPARSIDGQDGRVARVDGRRTYRFAFEPNIKEFTEQLTGYMHVRLTDSMLVRRSSVPEADLVERVDDYYIYLKPPGADDAAILRKVKFPGKPPLWIPMPPH